MKTFNVEAAFGFGVSAVIEAENELEALEKLKKIVSENSPSIDFFESDYDCKSFHVGDTEFTEDSQFITEER